MAAGEVRVLGSVEILAEDGTIQLAGKHARLLAALVVADGRACGVDELVEAVWNRSPPVSARKLLQIYVSQLRKVLPPEIEVTTKPGAYAIGLSPETLDATRFERLLGESIDAREAGNPALALSLAERALSLWRGRAYGDLAYDEFAHAESERLEELRLVALEERIAARLARGSEAADIGEALALAEQHPYRERPQELAMLALYRSGRHAEALEHFVAFRARLDDELGLEPGLALRDLQRRILQHDPALEAASNSEATASALPVPPNTLVGRERELAELAQLLGRRDARLLVLTGAGGSGKTRLALEAARAASGTYANGAAVVELAPLRDPALVAPAITRSLGIAEVPDEASEETLARSLHSQELLLVVDNAEHLRESAPLLSHLVASASRLTILVTSRAVLHVSGERVFPVAPLDEEPAVQLFVERARLLRPDFEPSADDEEHVREICRRLDGLPLALELAAARIRTLPPAALRERLDARLGLLTGGPRDLAARQQTLRDTIAWSFNLLDERQRRVFARLAVFPGGATLAAAEVVCACDVDMLAALVDDHLVLRSDAHAEPRFGLLETIREFALDALGDERAGAERELSAYYADLVDRATLRGPGMEEWLTRFDAEVDNLRAALDLAEDSAVELRIAGGLWRYWLIRGFLAEGLERIERALERADKTATYARARALGGGASLAYSSGAHARAKALAEQGILDAQAAGAPMLESLGHRMLGVVAAEEREFATARHHIERCIAIVEGEGDEPNLEKLNLGVVLLDSGDVAGALGLFEHVLERWRSAGVVEGIAFATQNRGRAYLELGDVDGARRDFEEALQCFEELGYRAKVAHALQGLAATEVASGRHTEAARLLGRASTELTEVAWRAESSQSDFARRAEDAARRALGDEAFEVAFASASTMAS